MGSTIQLVEIKGHSVVRKAAAAFFACVSGVLDRRVRWSLLLTSWLVTEVSISHPSRSQSIHARTPPFLPIGLKSISALHIGGCSGIQTLQHKVLITATIIFCFASWF